MNVLFVFVLFFTVSEAFSRRDRQFPEYWPYIINPFDELDSSLQQFIKILMDKSPQHIEASSQNLPLTSSEERMEELIWHSPSLNSFSSNNQISHFLDKSKRNIGKKTHYQLQRTLILNLSLLRATAKFVMSSPRNS
jgi:hypothetical protein